MSNMPLELYTDGSCLKNPGAGGLAYIIRYWEPTEENEMPKVNVIEGNQGFRLTTNNRMEIMAGLYGIRAIIDNITSGKFQNVSQINLSTDSEYFCKAITMKWINKWVQNDWMTSGFQGSQPKPVKNKDLWEQVLEIQNQLHSMGITLTISHVKGHNGHEWNERADNLAVAASTGTNHIIDEVYEKTTQVKNMRNDWR